MVVVCASYLGRVSAANSRRWRLWTSGPKHSIAQRNVALHIIYVAYFWCQHMHIKHTI